MHVQPHQEAGPQTKVRAKYIEKRITDIQNDTTHVIIIPHEEIQQDDTVHPTKEGTSTLLQTTDIGCATPFIKESAYMTTPTLYQGFSPFSTMAVPPAIKLNCMGTRGVIANHVTQKCRNTTRRQF